MRWFFLESVLALGASAFLVNFALLVRWRRGGTPRPLLIALLVSAALLAVSIAVGTPREHVTRILRHIERDLPQGRTDALSRALAPDFRAGEMSADAFLAMVRERLDATRVLDLRRTDLMVVADSADNLAVEAAYLADVDARGGYRGYFTSRWGMRFARRRGEWRILSITPMRLQGQPVTHFDELPR